MVHRQEQIRAEKPNRPDERVGWWGSLPRDYRPKVPRHYSVDAPKACQRM